MSEHGDTIRDLDDVKRRAGELCVQFVLTEDRCAAAEAENARLRAVLVLADGVVDRYGRQWAKDGAYYAYIDARAALASGSEIPDEVVDYFERLYSAGSERDTA